MKQYCFLLLALFSVVFLVAQRTTITDKQIVNTSLQIGGGTPITRTMTDGTLTGATNADLVTAAAVKTYVDGLTGGLSSTYFPLTGGTLTGTGGVGRIVYPSQASTPSTPGSGFAFYADATGRPSWRRSDGFVRTFDASTITANRVFTLQDKTYTLADHADVTALQSTVSGLGSTYFPLLGGAITGTGGAGFIGFPLQSSAPSTPANGFRFYADASGRLAWKGSNGFVRVFDGTSNTADRSYTLPDVTGTIAMLEGAQTFTGVKTFTPGGSSGAGLVYVSTLQPSRPWPVMTTAQRNALTGLTAGDVVYTSTNTSLSVWNGAGWEGLLRATSATFTPGSVLFAGPTGAVSEDNSFFRYTNTGTPTMVLGGLTIRYDATGTRVEGQPGGSLLIGQSGTGNPSGHNPITGPYLITLVPTSTNGRFSGTAINTVIYGGVATGASANFTNVTAIGIDAISTAAGIGNYTTNLDGGFLYGPNSSSSALTSAGLWSISNVIPSTIYIGVSGPSHSNLFRSSNIMYIGNKNINTWSFGSEYTNGATANFTIEFPSERRENPNANVTGYSRLHAGNHAGVGSGRQLRFAVTFPTTTKASNDPFDTPTDVVTIPGTTIGMGIGTTAPNVSAILDARSTQKGILFPTLTTTERNNILTSVQSITITNGGSGYTTTGSIVLTPSSGTGLGVTYGLTGGAITVANVTNGGYNFLPGATATISGGGGTGATVNLNLTQYPNGLSIFNSTFGVHQFYSQTTSSWWDFGSYQPNLLTIGTMTPDASAIFQINSTNRGFLGPRTTTSNINAISTPPANLRIFSTDAERQFIRRTGGWYQEAFLQDIKRDTAYRTVNSNLDLSGLTTTFANRYKRVVVETIVTVAATGNNTITMPVPTADLLSTKFEISVEDTSGDGDISVLSFGTDGTDGYLYNGDGTYASSQNLFPGIGVYVSVSWCQAKGAYRWKLQ